MSLEAECRLDGFDNDAEGRRVSCVSECLQDGLLLAIGEIELPGCAIHDVGDNDTVDLLSKRLDCDCGLGRLGRGQIWTKTE